MYRYHILLGGNIGNTPLIFRKALSHIYDFGSIEKKSSLYRTLPWGKAEQRYYFNQMILLRTKLGPFALLRHLKKIEKNFHRIGKGQMLPRKLDLDIIYFEDRIISSHHLTIPHEHLHKRHFVLLPLKEISPQFIHPILNMNTLSLLEEINNSNNL